MGVCFDAEVRGYAISGRCSTAAPALDGPNHMLATPRVPVTFYCDYDYEETKTMVPQSR